MTLSLGQTGAEDRRTAVPGQPGSAHAPRERASCLLQSTRAAGESARHGMFIAKFIKDPASVGAIAPSSRRLAAAMVGRIDFARARAIVELGPGTGVFSAAVLAGIRQAGSATRFIAVE